MSTARLSSSTCLVVGSTWVCTQTLSHCSQKRAWVYKLEHIYRAKTTDRTGVEILEHAFLSIAASSSNMHPLPSQFAEGCGEVAWTGDILGDNTFVSGNNAHQLHYSVCLLQRFFLCRCWCPLRGMATVSSSCQCTRRLRVAARALRRPQSGLQPVG